MLSLIATIRVDYWRGGHGAVDRAQLGRRSGPAPETTRGRSWALRRGGAPADTAGSAAIRQPARPAARVPRHRRRRRLRDGSGRSARAGLVTAGFLLDTNVVSALRKRHRADPNLLRWFARNEAAEFWLSVLVVGELRRGVELIRRRDEVSAARLTTWFDSLMDDYADRVLPVTVAIAERWARITTPDPAPAVDGLLAATALEHGLVLVTRNVSDVARTGVPVVDPFAQ
ncbi:MAG: type II toxin-antitoxin system VapC family toxin [Micropruina sp.]|nr:type II toxin-antitoxin system VapC family toxin [Micropruina sp.]